MNRYVLEAEVQEYISNNLNADVLKIAMGKSPFANVSAAELANQIAAKKKAGKKLPDWYQQEGIYYPSLLSVEQCSSQLTAAYKSTLTLGSSLIDLTGGFGVDTLFFARNGKQVVHCEINPALSAIAAHNASVFGLQNIRFIAGDGIEYLQNSSETFDTIYLDPARRSSAGKVFMLKDCTPNVVDHLPLLLNKSARVIIKTAPLLDLSAGLKELKNVAAIHIVSVKNECKELLWVLEKEKTGDPLVVCTTLNDVQKTFSFRKGEEELPADLAPSQLKQYLYEPDVALLKSGAFNLLAQHYNLHKLDVQTQLYTADECISEFPGRRFRINGITTSAELKKQKNCKANVISRNYQEKAEQLIKKYKILPGKERFLIFTQSKTAGHLIIDATIEQYY